jgi:hypothetical protein
MYVSGCGKRTRGWKLGFGLPACRWAITRRISSGGLAILRTLAGHDPHWCGVVQIEFRHGYSGNLADALGSDESEFYGDGRGAAHTAKWSELRYGLEGQLEDHNGKRHKPEEIVANLR